MRYEDVLKKELIPAFGCTEPIALAFASAKMAEALGKEPDRIVARCSGNIIKNAKSVTVPGTGGRNGIRISCTIGAIAGDADKNLEVLSNVSDADIARADELVKSGYCDIELAKGVENLFIEIIGTAGDDQASVRVEKEHTLITRIVKNGEVLFSLDLEDEAEEEVDFSFEKIYDYAKQGDIEGVRPIIKQQMEYNLKIAREGLNGTFGAEVGRLRMEMGRTDLENELVAYAAAGSDARMSGSEMPVVINSGSGNQGITVSVPITVFAEKKGYEGDELYRALVFANLIGLYLKQGIGRLSAYCGAVSAASASVAGIAFLEGQPQEIVKETLINALAANSGLICDGAKASCASKIASSLEAALLAYRQAKRGSSFKPGDGIVKDNVDETIKTVGHIARYGMKDTDYVILNEMLGKNDYIQDRN